MSPKATDEGGSQRQSTMQSHICHVRTAYRRLPLGGKLSRKRLMRGENLIQPMRLLLFQIAINRTLTPISAVFFRFSLTIPPNCAKIVVFQAKRTTELKDFFKKHTLYNLFNANGNREQDAPEEDTRPTLRRFSVCSDASSGGSSR